MKNWLLSLLVVLGSARAFSQQDYFIYLQADNHQLFYLRMNDKVYSSTESGYLILPRLSDTSYHFVIGFPANLFPEQSFHLTINHKDAGYLVKNFGDKGWGLFNLQTLAVIMNSNNSPEKKSPELNVTRKTDAFSLLLANAVNDSSILYTSPRSAAAIAAAAAKEKPAKDSAVQASRQEPKPDTTALTSTSAPRVDSLAVSKNDTPVKKEEPAPAVNSMVKDTVAPARVTDSIPAAVSNTPAVPLVRTITLKVAELLTDTSYIAVYTDGTTEKYDTIRISIPLDKPGILIAEAPRNGKTPVYDMPGTERQKDSTQVLLPPQNNTLEQKPEPVKVKDSTPVKDSALAHDAVSKDRTDTLRTDTAQTVVAARPIIPNSTCNSIAWDSDIDKLRVKMLATKTDDDRIVIVKKLFKQKCVTVKQIKALSELFVTDEGKYKWFEAAYPSASDSYNYSQLADLIKDSYYQSRFKAMIRQ